MGLRGTVIARLLSDSPDGTMTERRLDESRGAFRCFHTRRDEHLASGDVSLACLVAAPTPARPGFVPAMPASLTARRHALQVSSNTQ
jgi:hypothetical protein